MAELALANIQHPKFNRRLHDDEAIAFPYLWWFHRRTEIGIAIQSLDTEFRTHVALVEQYIQDRLGQDWRKVDSWLMEGRITAKYLEYLFVPEGILVSKAEGVERHQLRGVVVTDWIHVDPSDPRDFATINVTSWDFGGSFFRTEEKASFASLPTAKTDGSFAIQDLFPAYPIKYATPEIVERLKQRGEMIWRCRFQHYVSYTGFAGDGMQPSAESRFMIDFSTFNQMHPQRKKKPSAIILGDEDMSQDEPNLGDAFFMCLPAKTVGLNMHKKEWVDLEADFLEDVRWNDEAFKHLVIDSNTKELVQAVITTQLKAEENTDLIRGKGNGLFILLHGGRGTGKTLTAESVAEIAKKPLYRVTCGDIGTSAEIVEKYLESVLLLGKTWGCVVLLDEADVFLEERSLKNIERNALVSVFLRVLEYYDGILILTSNRVGTFDEAFKSRIQLNLRYQNLNEQQRFQIWTNFIDRIEKLNTQRIPSGGLCKANVGQQQDFGIDAEEIRHHLTELAKTNLNDREIRNAISTARQLAVYKGKPLGYQHINSVIKEATKFDEYLREISKGYTADDIRRGRGER
ncbi:AAA family ATPase [Colletotrichum chrysophilum]|uniref:AAA family ATPase n=1 Tax=Colletotrichum chrysophilum TaxID=1836956 RepID=A0AAD9A6X5_9PEZI|nr:AAA family ATPase [Colletotrichum chrysophilum]